MPNGRPTSPVRRAILALAAALSVAPLWAQNVALTGHVTGPGGVAVPGATVELTDTATGARKVTWTDAAGNYDFPQIAPGAYKLSVSLIGFKSTALDSVQVAGGAPARADVTLALAPPAENPWASRGGGRPAGQGNRPDWNSLPPEVRERIRERMQATGMGGRVPAGAPGNAGGAANSAAGAAPGGSSGNGELNGANGGSANATFGGSSNSGTGAAAGLADELGAATGEVQFSQNGQNGAAGAGGAAPSADNGGAGAEAGMSDLQASASNSFLLSGSVGQAPTPTGEARDQRLRQRFMEWRQMQAGGGFEGGFGGGGFGGGGFGGGGPFIFFGGPGAKGRARVNRLRGNLFERYANSALDARPYPLNVAESPQIPSYQEQFGGSIGGPLTLPRIYHGADKTSFFVNFNVQRGREPFDAFSTVPTLAERAGDFSQAAIASGPFAGQVPTIYDPASNPSGPRTAFNGNVIPTDRLNSAALGLLPFIPLPNLPGGVQNFHLQEALPSNSVRLMGRVGHRISSKDNLALFYFFNQSATQAVGNFPALSHSTSTRGQNVNLSETHTFGSRIVNTFLANFNRQRISTLNPFAFQQNIAGQLGITGIADDPRDWGVPVISYTNFAALNDTIPSLTRNQTLRTVDFLLINRGQHNVRLGGEVRRVEVNTLTNPDARGTFTFTGFTTSNLTPTGQAVAGTGFDFADFLLGLPQATSVRFGVASNYLRSWVYSGFAQDDWRATSRLTFDFGLRYEYFQPFTEKYGHLSNLDLGPGFTNVGVVTGQAPGALPSSLIFGDSNNLAPRFGLAYRPWTKHNFVIRSGYGIFFDGSIYQRIVPNLVDQPPFAQASTLLTSPTQVLTLQNGFPALSANLARNTYAVDPHFRAPYGQTWNFTLEDEIARNVTLSVGYVGTKGTKLDLLLGPNPAGRATGQQALQYTYETSGAASIYHGLQVNLRRQFHGGFSLWGNYTFSKSIDNAASVGGAGNVVAQNYLDLAAERGLSVFDVRHRLLVNYNYELPFGDRKKFLNRGGAVARVLGSWQVSGVTTLQSGTPYTARLLGNLANNAGTGAYFSERAEATGQPVSLPGSERTTQDYFNTAAFTVPPAGQLGNAGRNTIPGPGRVNFNMSLDRFFVFSREKGMGADFRLEAANLFNTPNYTGLATVVGATDFGRVTSVGTMRTLDFSIRFRF